MPKKNGFCLYMEKRRAGIMAAGHKLPGGKRELADLVSGDWRALTEEERNRYAERARQLNERVPKPKPHHSNLVQSGVDVMKPLTNAGNSGGLSDEDKLAMKEARSFVFKMFQDQTWKEQPIAICSFTVYFDLEYLDTYLPAEVGVSIMNLQEGVVDNFARIIDPGNVPLGHRDEVARAVGKLGLPIPGSVREFADYKSLMITLNSFLGQYQGYKRNSGEYYVFAFDSDYLVVRNCLDWLLSKAGSGFTVKILSLDQYAFLASALSAQCANSRANKTTMESAEDEGSGGSILAGISRHREMGVSLTRSFIYPEGYPLTKFGLFTKEEDVDCVIKQMDNYKYLEEICCVYHTKAGKQAHNCALNLSNRYAYSLLEILTLSNEVPIRVGGHYPQIDNPKAEKSRRWTWLFGWGVTRIEEVMKSYSLDEEGEARNSSNLPRKPLKCCGKDAHRKEMKKSRRANRSAELEKIEEDNEATDTNKETTGHSRDGSSAQQMEAPITYRYGPLDDGNAEGDDPHPYTGAVPQIFRGGMSSSHH